MSTDLKVGIDAISFYTSHYCLEMSDLAQARGQKPDKFIKSLGQEKMAVAAPGEDAVTLGANAAAQVLKHAGVQDVDLLVFGTESGVDQAKGGGLYIHGLLGLPSRCRVIETKQACYGATAGIQLAVGLVRANPKMKALIIASDIAKYGLETVGEPTQGACAVAMIISANPRLLALDPWSGLHAEDVMDFWRPNYRKEALVDGKLSVRVYTRSLQNAWEHYKEQSGLELADFSRFCYHMPFTRMATIAHGKLFKHSGLADICSAAAVEESQRYSAIIGNSYTAALYLGLASLVDHCDEDLAGKRTALFSYGSGAQAEFFSGVFAPNYRDAVDPGAGKRLATREHIDIPTYEELYRFSLPEDGSDFEVPVHNTGAFRLARVEAHKPIYVATS